MLNWVRSDLIKWSRDSIRHTGPSVGPGAFPRVQLPADPLDARVIASFVTIMPTRPAQRQTPAAERLAEMLAIRSQLSTEKVAVENASRLLEDAMLQRLSRRRIVRLAADIDLLDKRMVEIVATDDVLVHRYRLLTSMPGVGAVLACTLIALLPELGRMSRKQVAALVGVAPYAFESGTLKRSEERRVGKECRSRWSPYH